MTQKRDTSKLFISMKAEKAISSFLLVFSSIQIARKPASSIQAACEAMAATITRKLIEENIITYKME